MSITVLRNYNALTPQLSQLKLLAAVRAKGMTMENVLIIVLFIAALIALTIIANTAIEYLIGVKFNKWHSGTMEYSQEFLEALGNNTCKMEIKPNYVTVQVSGDEGKVTNTRYYFTLGKAKESFDSLCFDTLNEYHKLNKGNSNV